MCEGPPFRNRNTTDLSCMALSISNEDSSRALSVSGNESPASPSDPIRRKSLLIKPEQLCVGDGSEIVIIYY